MFFPDLKPESRVWVYTADRSLTDDEVNQINDALKLFIPQWAAHGNKLLGNGLVHRNRFLILVVDESEAGASGCSIDNSVRFVKEAGTALNVDFFNRLNLVLDQDGEMQTVHLSELKENLNAKVYNPMVSSLEELNNSWLIPVADSPFV